MRRVASSIVMLAVLVTPSMAFAQAGDGQIKAAAKAGERVSVVDDAGRKVEGHVEAWSEEAVRLSIRGASQEIPIDRIVRIDKPDSLKNGALTGLGVGLGLGFLGRRPDAGRKRGARMGGLERRVEQRRLHAARRGDRRHLQQSAYALRARLASSSPSLTRRRARRSRRSSVIDVVAGARRIQSPCDRRSVARVVRG